MPISRSEGTTTDRTVPKHRSVMPADLFMAAITGDNDVFVRLLGLPKDEQNQLEVKIEAPHSPVQLPVEDTAAEYNLDSTTQFGDTVLHLLLAKSHNELALKVFERNKSLLKARNNNLETPLHCAAKVGNEEAIRKLILLDSDVVKDALGEANSKGDTALHVAATYGHGGICCELMKLDHQMACHPNKDGLSALQIATIEGYSSVVESMLQVDPTLACTQFSDGMFPILLAAKMGDKELVMHFITNYPRYIEFLDPQGKNIYHMAAEQEDEELIVRLCNSRVLNSEGVKNMINAIDYEGNTPLHIAARVGHRRVMSALWNNMRSDAKKERNRKGQTPFDISAIQVKNSSAQKDIQDNIDRYVEDRGREFTNTWFKVIMNPQHAYDQEEWERAQIVGLGSVLVTTVTFAAAFTIPGGYSQNDGAPIFGRKYAFKAFILANTISFAQAFTSMFTLVSSALYNPNFNDIRYATDTFLAAACCSMIVAFALGSYVMLVPVSKQIAIITVLLVTPPMLTPSISKYIKFNLYNSKYTGLLERFFCRLNAISMVCFLLLIFLFAFL